MANTLEIGIKYRVEDLRSQGLEAKWGKTRTGRPAIFVRNPKATAPFQRENWWLVDRDMFATMKRDGVVEAFEAFTLLGDVFSVLV